MDRFAHMILTGVGTYHLLLHQLDDMLLLYCEEFAYLNDCLLFLIRMGDNWQPLYMRKPYDTNAMDVVQ